jgi:hypothetical protein
MYIDHILCQEAWEVLIKEDDSILVDVRSDFEWQNVGIPKLLNKKQLLLNSLKLYPLMTFNPNFVKILLENIANKSKIFFLCRYGARSLEACQIASKNGLDGCYNLIDGFDGNEYGPGWKKSELPFTLPIT